MNKNLKLILALVAMLCMIFAATAVAEFSADPATCLHPAVETKIENEVEDPTCTENATHEENVYCAACGELLYGKCVVDEPALGHNWQYLDTLKAADCTKDIAGIDKMFCLTCEATTYMQNDGHNVVEDYVEATCKHNAMIVDVCTICEDIVGDPVKEYENTQLACGLKDEKNRILVTVAPKDYKGTEEYKAPTCDETGYGHYICKFCGEQATTAQVIPAEGHDYKTYDIYVAETCETANGLLKVCTKCGDESVDQFEAGEEGYIKPLGAHKWETIETVKATCKAGGYTLQRCSVCDKEQKIDKTDADKENGHEKKLVGEALKEATCTSNGIGKFECALCGEQLSYQVIPADHTWYTYSNVVATCKQDGEKVERCIYECVDENGKPVEQVTETKAATVAHSFTKELVKPATCTDPQLVGTVCAVCEKPETALTPIGTKLGHKWTNLEVKEAAENAGYDYYVLRQCDVCKVKEHVGITDGTNAETIIPHNEVRDEKGNYAATCSTKGWGGKYVCTLCGEVTKKGDEIAIDPTAHEEAGERSKLVGDPLKAATCTTTGIGKFVCAYCEKAETAEYHVIEITHEWVIDSLTPATCAKDGEEVYICAKGCVDAEKKPVVKKVPLTKRPDHDYQEVGIPATCTEPAVAGEQCSVCKEWKEGTYKVLADKTGHTWTTLKNIEVANYDVAMLKQCSVCGVKGHFGVNAGESEETEIDHQYEADKKGNYDATCVKTGWEGKEICKLCGDVKEGKEVAIDKTKHENNVVMYTLKAATCTTDGIGKYGCSACGIIKDEYEVIPKAHSLVEVERVDATCKEDGYVIYECEFDCKLTEAEAKKVLSKTEVEHTWKDFYSLATCGSKGQPAMVGKKCEVCEAIDEENTTEIGKKAECVIVDTAVDATCIDPSGIKHECKNCHEYTITAVPGVTQVPAKDHQYEREVVKETCKTDGYTIETCKVCDYYKKIEGNKADGVSHVSVPAENPLKPATCTEDGIGKHVCELCGKDTGYQVIPKDHAWTLTSETEATCGKAGEKIYVCSLGCVDKDGKAVEKKETIKATGKHVTDEEVEAIAATCGSKGQPAMVGQICEVCGEVVEAKVVEGSTKAACKEVPVADKAATCKANGYKNLFKCEVCGEEIKIEGIYEEIVVTAENKDKYHVLKETPVSEATCSKTGISKYECELCDYSEYLVKEVKHDMGEALSSADGTCVYKVCSICGAIEYVEKFEGFEEPDYACELTGKHTEEVVKGFDATCTDAGLSDGTKCSICKQPVVAQETIDALGHAWDEGVVTVEPTLEAEGEKVYTCGTCGATETEVLDKITHVCVAGEAVEENRVEATCEADGSYEVVVYCTECGAEMGRAPETIPALGHAWDDGVVTVEPTLEAEGEKTYTCGTCSATKTEAVDKITHVHEYTSEVTEATCEEGGYTTYTCAECGDTYVADEVPALGHDYATEVTKATCEEGGYTTYTCGVCGDSYKADEVAAAGHDFAAATCSSAKKCTVCGETEGEAKGHSWKNPTYDYNEDYSEEYVTYTCSGCGEKKTETNPF